MSRQHSVLARSRWQATTLGIAGSIAVGRYFTKKGKARGADAALIEHARSTDAEPFR
jgi:hypothetical protein